MAIHKLSAILGTIIMGIGSFTTCLATSESAITLGNGMLVVSINTVNGRLNPLSPSFYLHFVQVLEMCGPHRRFAPLLSRTLRRIP